MDTAALKASWGKVVAACDDVPLTFYSHLRLEEPELRSMFRSRCWRSATSWWPPCALWSRNVDELDNPVPLLKQLGRDHRCFSGGD
jgi:hypothetical protein